MVSSLSSSIIDYLSYFAECPPLKMGCVQIFDGKEVALETAFRSWGGVNWALERQLSCNLGSPDAKLEENEE